MTNEEVKKAMHEFSPVKYDGIVYSRITALTYRVIKNPHKQDTFKTIFQVELLDKNNNSVTIANPEKVEMIR